MRLMELESDNKNTIFFMFVRSNPPTYGYKIAFDKFSKISKGYESIIFINPIYDVDYYPLKFNETLKYNKLLFPKLNFHPKSNMSNPFKCLEFLAKDYSNVVFVTDDKSANDLERMYKYAESWGVNNFNIIPLGDTKEGIPEGTARSDAIEAARMNDYDAFKIAIPTSTERLVSNLFLTIRRNMLGSNGDNKESEDSDEGPKKDVQEALDLLKALGDCSTGFLTENTQNDLLENKTINLGNFFNKLSNMSLVFAPKRKSISYGKNNQNGNYVLMMNTTPEKLQQYLDVNESRIIDVLDKMYTHLSETTTSSNISSVNNLLGQPIKRDQVDYQFINEIKFSKYSNKRLVAINEFMKKYGFIDKEAISKIEEKLDD